MYSFILYKAIMSYTKCHNNTILIQLQIYLSLYISKTQICCRQRFKMAKNRKHSTYCVKKNKIKHKIIQLIIYLRYILI